MVFAPDCDGASGRRRSGIGIGLASLGTLAVAAACAAPAPAPARAPPISAPTETGEPHIASTGPQPQRLPCDGHPTYRLARPELAALLDHPDQLARLARIVPIEGSDDSGRGFRLYGIRDGTLLYAVGLRNGDLVLSINDVIPDIEHIATLDPAVRRAPEILIRLLRDEEHLTLCVAQTA